MRDIVVRPENDSITEWAYNNDELITAGLQVLILILVVVMIIVLTKLVRNGERQKLGEEAGTQGTAADDEKKPEE